MYRLGRCWFGNYAQAGGGITQKSARFRDACGQKKRRTRIPQACVRRFLLSASCLGVRIPGPNVPQPIPPISVAKERPLRIDFCTGLIVCPDGRLVLDVVQLTLVAQKPPNGGFPLPSRNLLLSSTLTCRYLRCGTLCTSEKVTAPHADSGTQMQVPRDPQTFPSQPVALLPRRRRLPLPSYTYYPV